MIPPPLVPPSRAAKMRHAIERAFPFLPAIIAAPILALASVGGLLLWNGGLKTALLALPLLLIAQTLRGARLALLLRQDGIGLRAPTEAHAAGSLISLLLPFKIGEIWRWLAIARTGAGHASAFFALWTERLLDATLLAPLLVCAILLGIETPLLLVFGLSGFLLLSLVLLGVGPKEAPALARAAMARRRSATATKIMAFLLLTGRMLARTGGQIRGQEIPLLLLTFCLWTAEALAVGILLGAAPAHLLMAPLAVSGGALSAELDPVDRLAETLGDAAVAYLFAATLAAVILWIAARLSKDRRP